MASLYHSLATFSIFPGFVKVNTSFSSRAAQEGPRRPQEARSGSAALPGVLASGQLQTAQEGLRRAMGADSGSAGYPGILPALTATGGPQTARSGFFRSCTIFLTV